MSNHQTEPPATPKKHPLAERLNRRSLLVVVSIAVLFAAACLYAYTLYAPCDDTYIYLVYAKNLLHGNGLTFNGTKVQGYTSVLWMILIVALGRTGVPLPVAANLLSVFAGLLALIATYRLARTMGLAGWLALAPVCLLATTGDFAFYMGNGLETVLFVAMVAFAMRFVLTPDPASTLRSVGLPVTLALAMLARPEGAMIALFVVAFLMWRTRNFAAMLRCVGIIAAIVLPVVVLLRVYYGDWLPNTYYAKVTGGFANLSQGAWYLLNYIHVNALLFFVLGYAFLMGAGPLSAAERFFFAVVIVYIATITVQGGDNLVGARALLPMTPLLFTFVLGRLRDLSKRVVVYGVIFAAVFNIAMYSFGGLNGSSWNVAIRYQAAEWRRIYPMRVDIGKYLHEHTEPDWVIALNAAGILPYYSERRTIDMLGLNDRHIARKGKRDTSLPYGHQIGDGQYVLGLAPDVIIFSGLGTRAGDTYVSEKEIYSNPEFVRYYDMKPLPHDYVAYFRRRAPGRGRP